MSNRPFEISVDTTSVSRSARGQVSGVLYAEFYGKPFPDPQWSDLVIVVLTSWLEALNSLRAESGQVTSLHFMDGPFRLDVMDRGSRVHVRAIDSRMREVVTHEVEVERAEMRRTLTDAAIDVLRTCSVKCWWSPEIDRLVRLVTE